MCQRLYPLCATAVLLTSLMVPPARAQVPSTDIWLAKLEVSGRRVEIGRPENVTRRIGYENQPYFLPNGKSFLYARGDSLGTDVYRYDLKSGHSFQVTETPESEYSPTPVAGGDGDFDVVRVESDGAQRLWRFEKDGSDPRVVLALVDSVGYFVWLDRRTVAMFVVGEPHTLRVVDVETGRETVEARDIGRSLLRIPRDGALSFLIHEPSSDPARYAFYRWNPEQGPSWRVIDAVETAQDAVWVDDTLLMASGSKLFLARPFDRTEWVEVADLGTYGVSGITRLAVRRDREWIAFVAAESP